MEDIVFKPIKTWVVENYLAILFAILSGLLTVLPHLLAAHALGNDYHGIPFLMSDNEDYYLARVQEIADGHGFVSSPYFYEYKNTLPVVPSIGEYIYATLRILTGLSSPDTLVLAKFALPLLLFLLVYTFIRQVSEDNNSTKNTWGAIAGACFIVLGIELIDYHTVYGRLTGTIHHMRFLSAWVRPVNPITGALFLFTYLHFLWRSLKEHSWLYPVLSGFLIALSLGYIFTVGIELTLLGFLFLFALWCKDFSLLKRLGGIAFVGIGIASLYWLSVFNALIKGGVSAGKNGLMHTHMLLPNKVLLATALLIALFIFIARKHEDLLIVRQRAKFLPLWFVFALLLSGMVVLNQQIVTGVTIWPYHFVQYTNPLAIASLFIVGFILLSHHYGRIWKILTGMIIVASVGFAALNATTYVYAMDTYRGFQDFAPAYTWLNAHAQKDCVVLSVDDDDELFTGFLPGFTSCNVYQTKNFVSGSTPDERVRFNFFVLLRMRGVGAGEIDEYLMQHSDLVLRYFYNDYQELFGLNKSDHIAIITPAIASEYKHFLQNDFFDELRRYRLDYVITRSHLSKKAEKELYGHLFQLFTSNNTTIYSFK